MDLVDDTKEASENDVPLSAPLSVPPLSNGEPLAYRLTGRRRSSLPPPPERDYLLAVTNVLIAAAHADGAMGRREDRAIRRILARLCASDGVPDWLEEHLASFDPASFELASATDLLRLLEVDQRRHVMELVREVCDADNAFELEEERYLLALVLALSLDRESVQDLVIHSASGLDGPAKRLFDIVFAVVFLVVAWPLLLLIALSVKLGSPGPVLFRQTRYGKDGEPIEVFKFRTMTVTENGGEVRQATRGDTRVTRVGAFLRRSSLDELPQFYNVLRGEMSVVGPRPHAVAHNIQYRTQILEYALRHKVKPGITGWAQVNGWRGETDTLEKMIQRVSHDLEYIRRHSLRFDVEIILRTIFGRKSRSNAY
ncbi:MAG TPA: exopolysaccharide biosynthesis polyprenyl glycosylphosphotransferase [Polyangiaceae bacterium]